MTSLCWKSHSVTNYTAREVTIYARNVAVKLKRTKLTFHTHQTMGDWYRLRDDISPDMEKGMHCSIYKEAWYHVILLIKRLDIVLSDFCPNICPWADIAVEFRCLRMGKIDVITYRYVINTNKPNPFSGEILAFCYFFLWGFLSLYMITT
jgi:hypothetical protein